MKDKVTSVTPRMVEEYLFLDDYLRQYYDVNIDLEGNLVLRSRRSSGVNLIIDDIQGVPLRARTPMGQIEAIWIDRLARYQGARGGLNETLYVYTTRGREILPNGQALPGNALDIEVKNGFERPKEFYVPKYPLISSIAFRNLGIVHWEPELDLSPTDTAQFSVLNTATTELVLFVEGMSKTGELVSFSQILKVKSQQ